MSNIKQITVNNNTYNLYDSTAARSIVLGTTDDLNNITTPGIYSCGGGNSVKNKPSGTDGIGVIVVHNATGNYYTQILTTSSNANTYRRTCINGTWSAWTVDEYTDTNTDTKMAQMAVAGTSTYTNYRPLLVGESSNATKDFTPSRVIGTALAFKNLYVRPSDGLIHATTFEGKATNATSADNAAKVNGHTVYSDVPADAVFTDTKYILPTASSTQKGGIRVGSNLTMTGSVMSITKANVTNALGYTPPTTNTTYGSATTTNLGLIRVGTTIVRGGDGKYDVVTSKLSTAGTAAAGLMSAADKKKLDHIAENANNYTYILPTASTTAKGGVKIGANLSMNGEVLNATNTTYSTMTAATASAAGKSGLVPAPAAGNQGQYLRGDGTWATPTNTTYNVATTSANGLMSSTDKSKLDGIKNMAMGVRGTVPGTPSVSDTSNSNRYLSGGTNGQGEWRVLPSIAWNVSGLGKSFKQYKSGATVPSGCGTSATAPTVNGVTTTAGRYYGVESDSNNRLFVNVPWTDTVGVTGTSVTKLRVLNQSTYNTATKNSNEIYFILE